MESIIKFFSQREIVLPVLIIVVTTLLIKLVRAIVNRVFTRGKKTFEAKRRTTIIELVTKILTYFIWAITIMMILDVYGVDTKGIIASLGIAGVVLGLALQDTVQDLMSGIYIILDNYYVIGDYIRINNFLGEVIEVTLKSTKIKGANGEVYIFANRNVNAVVNLSQQRAGLIIKVPTAYEEQTSKVESTLKEVVEKTKLIPGVFKDSKYLGIDSFGDSAINYAIIIYCKSSDQWNVKREVHKLIKESYEEKNIKIPYNQIEVHNGKEIL